MNVVNENIEEEIEQEKKEELEMQLKQRWKRLLRFDDQYNPDHDFKLLKLITNTFIIIIFYYYSIL